MGQIQINYEDVYSKTTKLKGYINSDLLTRIKNEYNQIQSLIDKSDGATTASLKEAMKLNQQKSIEVAMTLDKLLSFMENSSKQMQINELKMANAIMAGAKDTNGGAK